MMQIALLLAQPRQAEAALTVQEAKMLAQTPSPQVKAAQKIDLNLITTPAGTGTYTIAVGQGMLLNKMLPGYPLHLDFHGWTPERAVRDIGMPYHPHPGAIKYYKGKGLWSSEMEQR